LLRRVLPRDVRQHVLDELDELVTTYQRSHGPLGAAVRTCRETLDFAARFLPERLRDIQRAIPDWAECRYAVRITARTPIQSATAVLSLALGIALTTATFVVVSDVFFGTLPVPDAEDVVSVRQYDRRGGWDVLITVEEFERRRASLQSFTDLAAYETRTVVVDRDDRGRTPVPAAVVSANTFAILQVAPAAGRIFLPSDAASATPVVVINDRLRRARFVTAESALGSTLMVDGAPRTIIGVMPDGFRFPHAHDLWLPLATAAAATTQVRVFGRLAPGATHVSAGAELTVFAASGARARGADEAPGVAVEPFARQGAPPEQAALLWVVVLSAFLLLLVSSANVANLTLAVNAGRARELAIRAAVGASRLRLLLQLILESLVLGAVAAGLGAAGARAGLVWLSGVLADEVPYWADLRLDATTWLVVAGITVTASLVAGLAPAIKVTRSPAIHHLRDHASDVQFGRLSTLLVVAEITIAIGFLSGAGALGRALLALGFESLDLPAGRMLIAQVYFGQPAALLRADAPTDRAVRRSLWDAFLTDAGRQQTAIRDELLQSNGVERITIASSFPGNPMRPQRFELMATPSSVMLATRVVAVSDDFFDTLGIPVLHGRAFDRRDVATQAPVAVANQSFARKSLGNDALGRRIRRAGRGDDPPGPWLEFIGVVPDAGLNPGDPTNADGIYVPMPPDSFVRFGVRTAGDPSGVIAPLHDAVRRHAPDAQVQTVQTLAAAMAEPVTLFRSVGLGLAAIGGMALLLACAGVYAILSFTVARRRREIAIRAALGARPGALIRAVLAPSLTQLALGVAAGIGVGLAVLRAVAVVPFPVDTSGGTLLAAVGIVITLAGAGACAKPVRRALSVNPLDELRSL
jgi:predicted permease